MIFMTFVLFLFWIVLSGKFDAFHLTLGFLSAAGVAFGTRRLGRLKPSIEGLHAKTGTRWLSYLPWLMWQIVLSAVQVAKVVFHPKLPIDPGMIKFRCDLPHSVAHLTLANSITLTPGTVTINVEHDEDYIVHALTKDAADSLVPAEGEGDMQTRVRRLFGRWGKR